MSAEAGSELGLVGAADGSALAACRRAGMQVAAVPPLTRVVCPGCREESWLPSAVADDLPPARHLRRFAADHQGHAPPAPRRCRFVLLVEPIPTPAQVAQLYRRTLDVSVVLCPADGVGRLTFDLVAASLSEAVISAVADVESVALRPVRVDQDDREIDLDVDTVLEALNSALLLRTLLRHTPQFEVIAELASP